MIKLFCPICGQALDQKTQIFTRRAIGARVVVILLTCWRDGCAAYGRTTTPETILDPMALADWGFTPKFDLETGKPLEVCRA